ncbi:MAG: DivIVA domain-containing protein [Geodermatophilaceae bacterium]|nr:DivIVA domain-containing protein [Geodermatophilaceae bacterium]MDQ3464169.1 hypothetical protein [Actinomycetota bacterium]
MDREQPTEMIQMPAVSEFEVVLRGYDRAQVRETVERLDADVRIALTDRDAAVARASNLASQLSAVHAEMESLRRKLASTAAPTYETMGERIAHMLRLAEEEAAEIRRTAHTDTATLREEAQAMREQSDAQRQRIAAEAERIRTTAEQKAVSVLADAERKATALVSDAEAQREQLTRQTAERNKRVETDFEISLRARRSEAARAEAERLRASAEEANKRVAEATAEATRRTTEAQTHSAELIAQADHELRRIEGIRQQTLRQLTAIRSLLGSLPAVTEQGAAEPAVEQGAAEPATEAAKPQGTEPATDQEATEQATEPAGSGVKAPDHGQTRPVRTRSRQGS